MRNFLSNINRDLFTILDTIDERKCVGSAKIHEFRYREDRLNKNFDMKEVVMKLEEDFKLLVKKIKKIREYAISKREVEYNSNIEYKEDVIQFSGIKVVSYDDNLTHQSGMSVSLLDNENEQLKFESEIDYHLRYPQVFFVNCSPSKEENKITLRYLNATYGDELSGIVGDMGLRDILAYMKDRDVEHEGIYDKTFEFLRKIDEEYERVIEGERVEEKVEKRAGMQKMLNSNEKQTTLTLG